MPPPLKILEPLPVDEDERERDENRTDFTPEEGNLLREFFDLLYQINEREHVC